MTGLNNHPKKGHHSYALAAIKYLMWDTEAMMLGYSVPTGMTGPDDFGAIYRGIEPEWLKDEITDRVVTIASLAIADNVKLRDHAAYLGIEPPPDGSHAALAPWMVRYCEETIERFEALGQRRQMHLGPHDF